MRLEGELYRGHAVALPVGVAVVSTLALLLVAFASGASTSTFAGVWILLTVLSFAALTRGVRNRTGRIRRIGADARGLSVDGELVVPRHAIARARVEDERDGKHAVVVETHGINAPRIIRVESARIAQALADTLESPPRDLSEFDALPPWAHRMRWLAMILTTSPWVLFHLLRHLPAASIFVVIGLYGMISLPLLLPQKIAIGDDGILLKWAGRRRFIPFGALVGARVTALGVELELDGQQKLEIRLTHRADAEARRALTISTRIHQGINAHRALGPADDEALLARGQRDFEAWLTDMTSLGEADFGYRAIAIPRERLWCVLENPGADPSAREGAALALHARLDDDERERLVSISQKSASPRLRIAVDAVASADRERIRIALLEADSEDVEIEPRSAVGTCRK